MKKTLFIKFARGAERKTRDLDQVKCINDEEKKVKFELRNTIL